MYPHGLDRKTKTMLNCSERVFHTTSSLNGLSTRRPLGWIMFQIADRLAPELSVSCTLLELFGFRDASFLLLLLLFLFGQDTRLFVVFFFAQFVGRIRP